MNRISDPLREKYLQADQRPNDKPIYGSSARQAKAVLFNKKTPPILPKAVKGGEFGGDQIGAC